MNYCFRRVKLIHMVLARQSCSALRLTLSAVLLLPELTSVAGHFEASGTLTAEARELGSRSQYSFKVQVDGCLWKFRVQPRDKSAVQYYEDAFDGACVYSYQSLALPLGSKGNTSLGVIETNDVPCESSSLAPPLWLAFCSSCYLKASVSNRIPQIFDSGLETRLAGNHLRFTRELHANPPHLPTEVDFFSDGRAYSRDAHGILHAGLLPSPFDKGFRSGAFRSGAFTNAGGSWVPMEFSLEMFMPAGATAQSSNDVRSFMMWTGKADSIRIGLPGTPSDFIPKTDGKTLTEDLRFPPVGRVGTRVTYLNTNLGVWPPTSSRRVAGVYNALTRNDSLAKPVTRVVSHSSARVLIVITLLLFTGLPLAIILLRKVLLASRR